MITNLAIGKRVIELDVRKLDLRTARDHYELNGYVVLRGLIEPAKCDEVVSSFNREVRRSKVPMLRQKQMTYERNRFTSDGFLDNPIFNLQDLETSRFSGFKQAALDVITNKKVSEVVSNLLGDVQVKAIQSMFFEAPAGTWAHQDSYYQDSSSQLGSAVACWFALEDIQQGAGRFYVCPGSHRQMPVIRNDGELSISTGHSLYKEAIAELIRSREYSVCAPALAKGDVLLWSSLTVHGSFSAERTGVSRQSLTAHYLPANEEMLQFHSRLRPQKTITSNGMQVGLLHDQDKVRNRMIRELAFRFPNTYLTARRAALKLLLGKQKSTDIFRWKS